MVDPGFPQDGATNPPGGANIRFCQELHDIERNLGGGIQNFTMKIRHHITRNNRKTGVNVVALVNRFKHYYQQSEYKCECCSFSE